ncbi:hypothetical protein SLEP1_g58698 [Rubroshorea leprosula]|uniref:Uncharacterized protein n=1 Tax=Rubroshorea leprosula TaxID=152421 RepID=A0AAV5MQ53_9ROSI|nr:hypothetical protein SLEP1_g58698 [Rubroshorea leprosula]
MPLPKQVHAAICSSPTSPTFTQSSSTSGFGEFVLLFSFISHNENKDQSI